MATERPMVVATLYKLYRTENGFTKENKQALRVDKIVPRAETEKINKQWKQCGKYYEVSEAKTKAYYEDSEDRNKQLAEDAQAEKELSNVLVDLAKGKTNSEPTPQTDHKKEEANAAKKALKEKKAEITKLFKKHQTALAAQGKAEEALTAADEAVEADTKKARKDAKDGDVPRDVAAKLIAKQDEAVEAYNSAKAEAIKIEGSLDYVKGTVMDNAWLAELMADLEK